MGLSSKKQTQSSTQTSTPNNPAWVTSALQGYTGKVNDLAGRDASEFVTGPNATQQQAYTGAQGLGSATGGLFTKAAGLLTGDDYGNQYTNDVINNALVDYDQQAGQLQAGNAAAAAKNKAFGGSRYGLTEAMTNAQLNQDRSSLRTGLLSDAYDKSVANKLNTANALTNLGATQGSDSRANIATQLTAGADERDIAQQQATSDITLAQILGQLYGQGQYGLFQGNTTTGKSTGTQSGSTMDQIGQAVGTASSLAALFSDVRLKRDIKSLGVRNGRKWYEYKYLWSDKVHQGVMAHENPDIAFDHPSGYQMVNYGAL